MQLSKHGCEKGDSEKKWIMLTLKIVDMLACMQANALRAYYICI